MNATLFIRKRALILIIIFMVADGKMVSSKVTTAKAD